MSTSTRPAQHPTGPQDQQPSDPREPTPLVVTSYGLSDPGRERGSNEDGYVIAELARSLMVRRTNIPQPTSRTSSHRVHVFLVADGVGGNRAGEVASALSVTSVEEFLLNTFQRLTMLQPGEELSVLGDLHAALFQADARIVREGQCHSEWQGMGTTLTLALAVNRRLLVAHAGDSRCYLFSHGRLKQVTQDHTLAVEMERSGLLTHQEVTDHPWRHVVSNLLGGSEPGVRVELHGLELHHDDVVLLCSDGLTEMLSENAIAEILRAAADPQRACERLVGEANRLGGRDNVTVIVARFNGEPGSRS